LTLFLKLGAEHDANTICFKPLLGVLPGVSGSPFYNGNEGGWPMERAPAAGHEVARAADFRGGLGAL
jgi:hypothetical protein